MKSEPDTKLGFVGIGTMGAPMVRCLAQAGHRPILYDVDRDAAGRVAGECGLDAAGNLPDLGRACDTLILMLPRSDIVHAVCMGDGGGANGLDVMTLDLKRWIQRAAAFDRMGRVDPPPVSHSFGALTGQYPYHLSVPERRTA
jgi:hypothetical protein